MNLPLTLPSLAKPFCPWLGWLLLLWASACLPAQQVPAPDAPNIVFIIADDVGWNDFGCYGHPVVQTPHLDRLAARGLRFDRAFLTTSSCSPSRCSLISGRYPHNTGAPELHQPLAEGVPTFTQVLHEAGYYLAQAGKWHMGEEPRSDFDTIFDEIDAPGGQGHWLEVLKQRPRDRPFFLWLASIDAHRGWEAPNPFLDRYDPAQAPVPPYLVDDDSTRLDLTRYYAEVSRLDHYVGQVVAELTRQQVLDQTLILFISDNGRPFPGCKTRLYDRGIQMPMIAHWPAGIDTAGATPQALVSSIDIGPTLLDLAGLEGPSRLQGRSFAALLKQPTGPHRRYAFAEHNWHDYEALERSVRTDSFLYIWNERPQLAQQGPADAVQSPAFASLLARRDAGCLNLAQVDLFQTPRPREELYACYRDSLQLLNLAALPAYQPQLEELRGVLQQWRRATRDHTPARLTTDLYHRRSGKRLAPGRDITPAVRGTWPGEGQGALHTAASGPF